MPDAQDIQRDETKKYLFNPLKKDFSIEWRNNENKLEIFTIPSLEICEFPAYKANYIKKHLVDTIINEKKLGYVTPEKRAEIEKEVETEIDDKT